MPDPRSAPESAAPPTADPPLATFFATLARSKLLDTGRIEVMRARLPKTTSAREVTEQLIKSGDLTHYQVEKLLQGLWQGLALGAYRILAPLGRGGMGTVYLARRAIEPVRAATAGPAPPPLPFQSTLVALKILPPKRAREEEKTLLRFRRELELGRRVDHPNITRTIDGGEVDGIHFIALEFVPGQTLRQQIVQQGRLPVPTVARMFADVLAGLQHAHDRGLIHRDIKPANIMVTPDGRTKILDLGLALIEGEARGALDPLAEPADKSIIGGRGYILGTMDYIAPEQAVDARDVGPRSDLYAVGCSIFHALAGSPPFPGGKSKQKMQWHQLEDPPPLDQLNPAVSPEFARMVSRLMAKRPADRPADAETARMLLLRWTDPTTGAGAAMTDTEIVAAADTRSAGSSLWDAMPVQDSDSGGEGRPTATRRKRRAGRDEESDSDASGSPAPEDSEEIAEAQARKRMYLIAALFGGVGFCLLVLILVLSLRGR